MPDMRPKKIAVIMTGGTIAKSYDPSAGRLHNFETKVRDLIESLRADDLTFDFVDLMHMDSLDLSEADRALIVDAVIAASADNDGVLVTHGTDGMAATGALLSDRLPQPPVPIVFTGAMVPYVIAGSDALQNVTEALLALRLLPAGAYLSFHNRVLPLQAARKDYQSLTFLADP
ncbi:MAG: asparaginase [Rhizobiaceae bacterium]|nr:asparaginase [Rhizobiaceae bacterium]